MPISVEVIEGPHEGRRFEFSGRENFIVGRASVAHFRLTRDDRHISRVHFLIEMNPPQCRLIDMGSRNGTYVNGKRVRAAILKHGDLVRAGKTTMRLALLERRVPDDDDTTQTYRAEVGVSGNGVGLDVAEFHSRGQTAETELDGTAPYQAPAKPCIPGFELLAELGRGGMGVVYLARRMCDGDQVAIKTIQPAAAGSDEEVQRFLREARVLSDLRHPNIVRFDAMDEASGLLFFVMEYVMGVDAMQALRRDGPMETGRAVRLVCDVLDALGFAHTRGYVHRDVKPSNLLLEGEPGFERCKLADFGLAKAYNSSPLSGVTMLAGIGGTIPYMPPEQITNYRDAKPPADQYSAAATLYHLLTGQHIFDFGELLPHERMSKILLEEPVPLLDRRSDLPKGLAESVQRALQKEPAKRFSETRGFRDALLPFGE